VRVKTHVSDFKACAVVVSSGHFIEVQELCEIGEPDERLPHLLPVSND